ncbi:hypothetical protein P8452_70872 [Trifolium repens]|nr:hypothetical protein P8452_70872 [Trifolium repens]
MVNDKKGKDPNRGKPYDNKAKKKVGESSVNPSSLSLSVPPSLSLSSFLLLRFSIEPVPPSISVPHSLSSSIQFLSSYHPSVQSKQLFPFSHRSKPSLVNSVQFSRCFTHRSLQSHFANLIKAH